MGSIIRYVHKECGFEFNFHEGVGFHAFALQRESRKHMRNGDWGEHWKHLIEQYPEGTATLDMALCYCEKCKKYFGKPCIRFHVPKDGYHYEPASKNPDRVPDYISYKYYRLLETEIITCPDCESVATIRKRTSQIPCPICGEKVRGRCIGKWD